MEVGLVMLQESLGFSEDVGLLKLQVGEVRPKVFSTKVLEELVLVLLDIKSMADGATDPGVKVGSSSGFFNPGPFQGLPGSNSGMPKASIPFKASLLVLLDPPVLLALLLPGAPGALDTDGPPWPPGAPLPDPPPDFSGHPELVELEGKPQVSSPPKPNPGLDAFLPPALPLLLPPKRESPGVNFHCDKRDPPTLSFMPLLPLLKLNSLNRSGMLGSLLEPPPKWPGGMVPGAPELEELPPCPPIFWLFK